MEISLLKPREVDLLFRYPAGRSSRLAKAGHIPYILLPDGQIRFNESEIQNILKSKPSGKETIQCSPR